MIQSLVSYGTSNGFISERFVVVVDVQPGAGEGEGESIRVTVTAD